MQHLDPDSSIQVPPGLCCVCRTQDKRDDSSLCNECFVEASEIVKMSAGDKRRLVEMMTIWSSAKAITMEKYRASIVTVQWAETELKNARAQHDALEETILRI